MMSLTEPETQALGAIAHGLTGSDPRLASMLTIFSRLAAGEEMPARDKTRARRGRWVADRPRRIRIFSPAGISSPAASRLKMFSMEANLGSEPARPSAMEPRACLSSSVKLIIITSVVGE